MFNYTDKPFMNPQDLLIDINRRQLESDIWTLEIRYKSSLKNIQLAFPDFFSTEDKITTVLRELDYLKKTEREIKLYKTLLETL